MRLLLLILLSLTVAAGSTELTAQTRPVSGVVVDSSSGKPQAGAIVFVNRTRTPERTRKDGKFRVAGGTGALAIMVRLPGYVPASWTVAPGDTGSDLGTVSLRKIVTDADRYAVQPADLELYPQLAQFYERKASLAARGNFLTPDDLELARSTQLIDMLRRTPGMARMCLVNSRGELDCGRSLNRGPTTIMNAPAAENVCIPSLWYYGIGTSRPSFDEIRMEELIAVELYHQGTVPPEFSGQGCGSIVLWMKPLDG